MEEKSNPQNFFFLRILIIEDTPERQKILKSLFKDHAWVLVNTAQRAIRLLQAYTFDLISLDYNLGGLECGDDVAAYIAKSQNKNTKIIVHSMNKQGADLIKNYLPNADIIPISKIIKNNKVFKKIRQELERGVDIDWAYVFRK